jgi:molybdopterin-guanine dinucleotide biosynthesis protein A
MQAKVLRRIQSMGWSLAAALLAGGRSTRMGSDKALLSIEFEGKSCLLWEKQLQLLTDAAPGELLFSGPARPGLPPDLKVLRDQWEPAGPLGGIATCLQSMRAEFLLVLAVDLPFMNKACLAELIRSALLRQSGIVPVLDGYFEPLVAIYPKRALPIALDRIQRKQLKLQEFVVELQSKQLISSWTVLPEFVKSFANWNHPDLGRISASRTGK